MAKTSEQPPVNAGDILTVTITGKGDKGDGIARHKGFVIFVAGTDSGDCVKVKVKKVLAKVCFADVVEQIASKKVVPPPAAATLEGTPSDDFGE